MKEIRVDSAAGDGLDQNNPLLEALGPFVPRLEWPELLAHRPIAGIDRRTLSDEHRERMLGEITSCFEPVDESIRVARSMQRLSRQNYARRDPRLPSNKLLINVLLSMRGKSHAKLPWFPQFAEAMMVMGCTGLGKSHTIQRVCSLTPKMVVHSDSPAAGWKRQVQLLHLIVPMAAHRGGLPIAIIEAIGEAIGDEHLAQKYIGRQWSIEKLIIEVGVMLVQHYVGMLIIEEVQPRNLSMAPYRNELLLMLLRILNFGIPIVFVGNPLGFEGLEEHSQDMRRLTAEEPVHFMPPPRTDPDWAVALGPTIWDHSAMPVATPFDDEISQELWNASAGIAGFAARACVGAQRIALDLGDQTVTAQHLRLYRQHSQAFSSMRDLIEGFAFRDPQRLSRFLDVPWEQYCKQWGTLQVKEMPDVAASTPASSDPSVTAYVAVHKRIRTKYVADHTRASNRAAEDQRVRDAASPADLRSGNKGLLVAGLKDLQNAVQRKRAPKAPKE